MVTLGTLFFGALNGSGQPRPFSHSPRTWVKVSRVPFSHFPGWEAVSTWEGSGDDTTSHLTVVGVTRQRWSHPSALSVSVTLHFSEGWLAIWHLPPFLCTIVRISWVLFQSSLSCFHRHLLTFLELLQAHPATPTEQKDLLRRRKLHPWQHLYYGTIQTQPVLWEASIKKSFSVLYLLHHDANEGFFSPVETGIPSSTSCRGGRKKSGTTRNSLTLEA